MKMALKLQIKNQIKITLLLMSLLATNISIAQVGSASSDLILRRISFIVVPNSLAGKSFFYRVEGKYSF